VRNKRETGKKNICNGRSTKSKTGTRGGSATSEKVRLKKAVSIWVKGRETTTSSTKIKTDSAEEDSKPESHQMTLDDLEGKLYKGARSQIQSLRDKGGRKKIPGLLRGASPRRLKSSANYRRG